MTGRRGVDRRALPVATAGVLFTAVAAAEFDFTAFGVNGVAGPMAAGHQHPLAVAAKAHLGTHPDIPTLVEAGGPALPMHPWAALFALAGTPTPIAGQLQHDIVAAPVSAEVGRRGGHAGFETTPSTPQALRERIDTDLARYRPLVDEGRIGWF